MRRLFLIATALALLVALPASAAQPRPGRAYAGFTSAPDANGYKPPVTFTVSSNGRQLLRFTWTGVGCAGMFGGPGNPWASPWLIYKVGTIPVSGTGTFSVKNVSSTTKTTGGPPTYTKVIVSTVSGRFVTRDIATGTISYTETIKPGGTLKQCPKLGFSAVTSAVPAGAFHKLSPANGATAQGTTPTLRWQSSAYASSYRYCIDRTNNNRCDGRWTSTLAKTNVKLTGLLPATTYYWQAQALNRHGATNADGGKWFTLKTPRVKPMAGNWVATGFTGATGGGANSIAVTRIFFTVAASQTAVSSFGFAYDYSGPGKPPTYNCSGSATSSESTPSPIANNRFSTPSVTGAWTGAGAGTFQGSFDSATKAHGTSQLSAFVSGPGCQFSANSQTGTFSWTATHQ